MLIPGTCLPLHGSISSNTRGTGTGVTQNQLLFAQYLVGFLWSLGKFLITLTIDNLSLGICSALCRTSAKNTRSCSPECLETLREIKFGKVVRLWRDVEFPGAQPTEKAAGERTKQGLWRTWRRKGRETWVCWKLTACAEGAS